MMWNCKDIIKIFNRIGVPKKYQFIKFDKLMKNDFYIMMSVRKDAGKTTNWLLFGLVINMLYGETIEYLRNDEAQIRRAATETMFDVIRENNYISKIWNDEYNDIKYHTNTKKWNLVKMDEEGKIIKECETPCCVLHSLEKYTTIKSTYNNPKGNFMLYDEFPDTERSTYNQIIELMNQISTIGRERPENRVVMLGNNVNPYLQIFEELEIEKDVPFLEFGQSFEMETPLGTTLYCELLPLSEEKIQTIETKKIRFFGFNTPKMNAFNGIASWQGTSHQHIPDEELLSVDRMTTNRIYIHHRNRYIQISVFYDEEFGDYCFLHYANKPKMDDNVIMTLNPKSKYEFFGFGKFAPDNVQRVLYTIVGMRTQNKWYYATNSVGDMVKDYFKEMR